MEIFELVKKNLSAFIASFAVSFPACLFLVNQYVSAPQVESLKLANASLQTSYNLLQKDYEDKKSESKSLDETKDILTTNLNKSNSELTVNHYNVQNLNNKIQELNNEKDTLNLKLDQAYADNRKLLVHLKNYQENADILQKISNLELKKQNARNGHSRSVFDNKTDQEIRADNEVIAKEYQQQILNLQDKLKCVNQS
ncbi:hypothetical protein OD757_10365 [Acinetobacter sp. AYS6]|uniref:hypothetical protein n=1 Tax=Acinetobacter sp. AYS6 TaxID=2983297 RepID=UPI0021D6892F|nr:hypothetical protein [Acinetobacter sp. AYS6]MCU7697625.1 hypothetical protein [Acinetobacter sp. AYS6]